MATSARLFRLAVPVLGLGLLVACAAPAPEPADPPPAPAATSAVTEEEIPARSYEVRGEVRELPAAGVEPRSLRVRHEAIDDLVGFDGEVWGMDSMTMEFPLADDVSVEGLEVGDPVTMTLVVDWVGPVAQQITRLEELPTETELEFREARVPGDEAAP